MSDIMLFSNPEFGDIRTTSINDEVWFIAKDVAVALGYSNPRKAVGDHVDDDDKGVTKCNTRGGIQELAIINESGLYSLILSSRLEPAKRFKRWVTSEVLPTIRASRKRAANPFDDARNEIGWKNIYVAVFIDKSVKIGISENVHKRLLQIQSSSGKQVMDYFCSSSCSNAKEVEQSIHSHFENRRILGEWFDVSFEEAKEYCANAFARLARFEQADTSKAECFCDNLKNFIAGRKRLVAFSNVRDYCAKKRKTGLSEIVIPRQISIFDFDIA